LFDFILAPPLQPKGDYAIIFAVGKKAHINKDNNKERQGKQ